jgi:hypothetical protein
LLTIITTTITTGGGDITIITITTIGGERIGR